MEANECDCDCADCFDHAGQEARDEELEDVCEFLRQASVDAMRQGVNGDLFDALIKRLERHEHRT